MLKIRLQRIGKRGQAHFRVVVLEGTVKPKGEYLELLGSYNPHQKEFKVKKDRIDHWISKGAQVSPTVNNLLVNYKFWDKPKMQSWKPKQRPEPAEGKKEQSTTDDQQPAAPKAEEKPKTEEKVEGDKKEAPKEEPKGELTTNDEQPTTSETKEKSQGESKEEKSA